MGVETWLLVTSMAVLAWLYSKWRHSYWASRGVESPPTRPFLGHIHFMLGSRYLAYDKLYKKYNNSKFWGVYEFLSPVLVVSDPDLLKHIMVKDFEHFVDKRSFAKQKGSILTEMLTSKYGDDWKNLRAVMTPAFSSGKLRAMFPLVHEKAKILASFSLDKAAGNSSVDMMNLFRRFTLDVIASPAFGIECNTLSGEDSVFARNVSAMFRPGLLKRLRFMFLLSTPRLGRLLGLKVDSPQIEFFSELVRETIKAREGRERRGDFLDLLLEAKAAEEKGESTVKVFQENTLVAQSVLFLVAGYHNTSNGLALSSFLLAKHPHHQQRLRRELQELIKEHGGLSYQGVMEAKFLEAFLEETLRLYPPVSVGERLCTKRYRVPGTELTLNPGDLVNFPIWSLHRDPRYWPEAEEFRPERFLPENKNDIQGFTHMPFGIGPRNCIGMRFALLETKLALAQLVLSAEMKLAPGHEDLELVKSPFLCVPKSVSLLLTPVTEQ